MSIIHGLSAVGGVPCLEQGITHTKGKTMTEYWHAWEKDPKTGKLFKYCGFFITDRDAINWVKSQPRGKEGYRITNFGPRQAAKQHTDKVQAKADNEKKLADIKKYNAEQTRLKAEAREVAAQKQAEQRAKDKARQDALDAERKQVSAGAEDILSKHKADEAADLKAGINR